METKSPGVLLQSIPYLGKKQILKVFTLEDGLVTLMTKSVHSPFCIGEWVYRKKRGDIYTLEEGSLIDPLLELRANYELLSAAGAIAKDLLRSQLPTKKNSDLYALLTTYLKKLPLFADPAILVASFRLKLLLHEGLLSLQETCCQCGGPAQHLFQGESYCVEHASALGHSFSPTEWKELWLLSFARQFSLLQHSESAPKEKIERIFEERLH